MGEVSFRRSLTEVISTCNKRLFAIGISFSEGEFAYFQGPLQFYFYG